MKLKALEIIVNDSPQRIINFHDGLNLVTNRPESGRTGNSVGKSTLSRVVDFLFLGSIDNIYIDEEFKKPNKDVEKYFNENYVTGVLSFSTNLGAVHKISRSFSIGDRPKIYAIDGREVEQKEYEQFIQKNCFNIKTRRPSVRAVAPKFIRNDSHKMLNTTKFLDRHSGAKDYSELYLYLFGFENTQLLTEKRDASNLIGRRKRNSQSINSMVKEQKPSSEIKKYTVDARNLERDLLKFEYSSEYSDPISRLSELQAKEDKCTNAIMSIERKIENINTTVSLLSRDSGGYLSSELKAIYEFAGVTVDGAIRSLEEVILFHNNLVDKKKQFLTVDIPDLSQKKEVLLSEISKIRNNKEKVFSDMRSTESINNITNNLKKLGELRVELGKLEGLIDQQAKAKVDLQEAETALSKILAEISKEIEKVYLFEASFNEQFKKLSKNIHAEEYQTDLDFNQSNGTCALNILNTVSNPEGGKKKAEVIAFDFAYIHAVSVLNLNRPRFIFHDSIEDIDKKQIDVIFHESNLLPGQQILSMLSDKISEETYQKIEDKIVLLLDENEKFFGV